MQSRRCEVSPSPNLPKNLTFDESRGCDPCRICGHGTESRQGRTLEAPSRKFPVSFASREIAGQAFARDDLDVFNAQTGKFVRSKAPPETNEDKCPIAGIPEERPSIVRFLSKGNPSVKPIDNILQTVKFEGFGLLLLTGMERTDALENLANQGGFGRINETVIGMPPCQRCQTLAQRAGRKLAAVVGQIAGN